MLHREALTLHPVGHPDRPSSLNNLATTLHRHFLHRGSGKHPDDAQANARSALTLLKAHDPCFARLNTVLANIYLSLHRSGLNVIPDDTNDLNADIYHFKVTADSVSSGLFNRLRSSIRLVEVTDRYTHNTLVLKLTPLPYNFSMLTCP